MALRTHPARGSLVCELLAILTLAGSLGGAQSVWAADDQQRVLVVYSTRRDTQLATIGDQTMPRLLERGMGKNVDYYAEYIDAARFPEAQYAGAFRDYLRLKYRDVQFDALIAIHTLALEFLGAPRDELFAGTPIVFLSEDRRTRRVGNSAEVTAARDHRPTLDLARALQPDTKEVFVVVGSSSRDMAAERLARAQFDSHAPDLRFSYLSKLTTEELERRLASLPAHAIVYYLLFYQDAAGVNVNPLEYLGRLSAIANRPIYSWVDSTMNHGVVGGGFSSISGQIESVVALAVRVLRGERADSIPSLTANVIVNQVDWRQLQRWGISATRVPAGTRVMFRPPTTWDRYKTYILGGTILMLAQTGLIAVLLVQRGRLRRAEQRVRRSQTQLRASYERIRDLGGRLLAAQDAERSRIALELHDDVSQQMAVLSMNLQVLSGSGPGRDGDVEVLAREALEQVKGIVNSLRALSQRLYPGKLRLIGLVSAIASLQHDFSRAGFAVVFSHKNVPPGLPHDLTLALFRVVQEALQNAVKHSRAHEVRVHLEGRGGALALTVVDDGVGFDVDAVWGKGLGLISMQQRLNPIGGALMIHSTPGRGTRLEIHVPDVAAPAATTVAV
jgi:signal transduction histidine kinase